MPPTEGSGGEVEPLVELPYAGEGWRMGGSRTWRMRSTPTW